MADALEVSLSTIRRLAARDVLLAPAITMFNGTMPVVAYDMAVIERLCGLMPGGLA